ncbi:MAG TPA: MerR family transcriptional regulator [Candidatus Limnocylindria bacterium]|nr:MerR family transcriptional regulator [Candidatus Limnocylindria bacterium]
MFPIGAFARLAGISAKQLRAYDQLGLFRPVWVDPWSRYRYYSPAQLPELRRILALRQLGMPLEEIGELVRGGSLADALERRRAELERERRLVEERVAALDITVGEADVVVRPVAVEPVAVMRVADAVEHAFDELEAHVRDAGRRAHRPPGAIPSAGEIFVPVTGPIPETATISYRRLPASRMACVIVRGPYRGVAAGRAALERWVAAAGLEPVGPGRTLYLQFGADPSLRVPPGWVVDSDEEFLTELQLPVG